VPFISRSPSSLSSIPPPASSISIFVPTARRYGRRRSRATWEASAANPTPRGPARRPDPRPILRRAAMAGSWRRQRGARSWRTSTRCTSSPAARDSVLLRRASSRRRGHPFSSPFLCSAREIVGDRGRWWARVGSRSPSTAPNLKEAGAGGIFASSIPSPAADWIPGKCPRETDGGMDPVPRCGWSYAGYLGRMSAVPSRCKLRASLVTRVKRIIMLIFLKRTWQESCRSIY
jgi:hypothetical protein